jgi:hypothetical protein
MCDWFEFCGLFPKRWRGERRPFELRTPNPPMRKPTTAPVRAGSTRYFSRQGLIVRSLKDSEYSTNRHEDYLIEQQMVRIARLQPVHGVSDASAVYFDRLEAAVRDDHDVARE